MKESAKGEDLLLVLLWGLNRLTVPTLRNVTESYEGWEYRNRVRHQVRRMEQKKLLQREQRAKKIVLTLTETGRLEALGGRDQESRWARRWDGKWRMVLFDLPVERQGLRRQLLGWLRANGFGYLQQSVWITPDPVEELRGRLEEFHDDVEFFTIVEAAVCAGYKNEALVTGAWDFKAINQNYENYLPVVTSEFRRACEKRAGAELPQWLRRERSAWKEAILVDPLLPEALLPASYLGRQAWSARQHTYRALATKLASS